MSNSGTTAYPTGLDSYDPIGTATYEDDVGYDQLTIHNQIQYAVEAIEAKVGINSSAVTTSHDYKLSGVTGTDKAASKTGTETLTNKTISTGCALDANADSNFTSNSLYRQAIINGNFDVWQRGTSVACTTANDYTADRWYVETATAATDKTVSRQDGTSVAGSYYCARVAMVQDTDELLTFSQALESQNSIKFRGKKVTLSFYARGGAEFVADNATLVSKIVTGKGTDQKVLAFTTLANAVSQNNTLTTDWQKFTCTTTAVIAADITQIGISFAFTHAGSGTTTNYFELAQVQLCAGDVALPFMPKSYEEELRACQRYCQAFTSEKTHAVIGQGDASNTTVAYICIPFFARMRTTPTLTATATEWQLSAAGAAGIDLTELNLETSYTNEVHGFVAAVVAAGLTANRTYLLKQDGTANRVLYFSAEL